MPTSLRTRDTTVHELLDGDALEAAALDRNLRDIRFINAVLGWRGYAVRAVARHVRSARLGSFSLVDVASGSADIPLAIARWAAGAGIAARIVATDISPQIVAIARRQSVAVPTIAIEQRNALALPYANGTFDIALCTLALHHFEPETAVELLRAMARVGRHVLVFDVVRSRLAYAGSLALTHLLPMAAMTRHDAPASVRRAYSAPELRGLAERAGLGAARIWVGFPFRLALSAAGTS